MFYTASVCGCPENVMRIKIHQTSSIHWLPMYLSPLLKTYRVNVDKNYQLIVKGIKPQKKQRKGKEGGKGKDRKGRGGREKGRKGEREKS